MTDYALPSTHHRMRPTKIVATLGPASSTPEVIEALFAAGVDVFRLNFSHGTHDDHRTRLAVIRGIEEKVGRPISVLADLQGPKHRIGTFASGAIALHENQAFRLDLDSQPGDTTRVHLPHPEILAALSPGHRLLLDDGKVRLQVTKCGKDFVETIVEAGNSLSDRKGVNVPNAVIPSSALTPKDHADLKAALDMGVDWIALSFVQRPEDIAEAQAIIGERAGIIAKIEKPAAVACLDGILALTDAVMVARGDLGVEMPPEDVPRIQKQIVRAARHLGKPVIVATQMLESMINSPTPTRAEASDVATAVYDGADAVMLSAETAAGAYPLDAVRIMDRILARTQEDPILRAALIRHPDPQPTTADALMAAARDVVETIGAVAIATYTTGGGTVLRASRERPLVPILALVTRQRVARRLALSFGVHAVFTDDVGTFDEMVAHAVIIARRDGFANAGMRIVITAGVPFGKPGNTNILHIAEVTEDAV